MRRVFPCYLIIFTAGLFCLQGCGKSQMKYNVAREKGLLHMRDGKLEEALAAFSEAEEGMPEFGLLHYDMGVSLDQLERYTEAEERYSKCIQFDPAYDRAYNNRAVIYARQERYEEAIADCVKAIELNPADPLPYRNRGLSLFDLGRNKEAIEDFNVSLRLAGDVPETLLSRARALMAINQHEQALVDLNRVLEINEQNADAYLLIGLALRQLKHTHDADLSFARALELDPSLEIPEQVEVIAARPVIEVDTTEAIATSYLKQQGFTEITSSDHPMFKLKATKNETTIAVFLKAIRSNGELTLSAEEVEALREQSVCLVLYAISDDGTSHVIRHLENWSPQKEALVPAQYHYLIDEKQQTE